MKIKQRLITLFLLIGVLPGGIIAAIAFIAIQSELDNKTSDQLLSVAIKQEQKLNSLLQAKNEEVIKITNQYDLQTLLQQFTNNQSRATTAAIHNLLVSDRANVTEMQRIYLIGTDQKIIASTATTNKTGDNTPEGYLFIKPNEQTATNLIIDADGLERLCINAHINVDKQDLATISVIFRIDDLVAATQDYNGLGSTGETLLASKNRSGHAVSLLPLRHNSNGALTTNLDSLKLFNNLDSGYYTTTDYRGKKTITAARSIGIAEGWVAATKIDIEETEAPIIRLGIVLLTLFIISIIVIVVVAVWFGRFFTNPILQIAKTAQRIGNGEFASTIPLKRNDELGDLAQSINSMSKTIRRYISDLQGSRRKIITQNLELSHEEARLRASIESLRIGFIMTDNSDNILLINNIAQKILAYIVTKDGVNSEEPLRTSWTISEIDDKFGDNLSIVKALREARSTTKPFERDEISFAGRTLRIFITPIVDTKSSSDQSRIGSLIIFEDISDAKALERSRDEFFSIASHELRTPLTVVRGNTSMLKKYFADQLQDKDIRDMINSIYDSSNRLIQIVNDFLDISRIEQGRILYNLEPFNLSALVKKVTDDLESIAAQGSVVLINKLDNKSPLVGYADKQRTEQVLYNIIGNAIKFTHNGGRVQISARTEGRILRVIIDDEGEGIDPKLQPLLFRKFQQAGSSLYTRNSSRGTGLGLYVCRQILEHMNGSIHLDSSVIGVGSRFYFTLPLAKQKTTDKIPE
jgi:signal transduction histidine kinase